MYACVNDTNEQLKVDVLDSLFGVLMPQSDWLLNYNEMHGVSHALWTFVNSEYIDKRSWNATAPQQAMGRTESLHTAPAGASFCTSVVEDSIKLRCGSCIYCAPTSGWNWMKLPSQRESTIQVDATNARPNAEITAGEKYTRLKEILRKPVWSHEE